MTWNLRTKTPRVGSEKMKPFYDVITDRTGSMTGNVTGNMILASCPWGPVTAIGVDILTEMYELTNRLTNRFLGNIYGCNPITDV